MISSLSAFILKLLGWKLQGNYPYSIKQFILAVAPHTSNWDFPLGLLARSALKAKIMFAAKDSLFKPPFGGLFRWLGGYPVDRSGSANMVEAITKIFSRETELVLCIAPEGTRKKVDRLRTGFYYIAKGAGIPIVLCKFDYGRKVIEFDAPFYPTDDVKADFEYFMNFFKGVKGKRPEMSIGI